MKHPKTGGKKQISVTYCQVLKQTQRQVKYLTFRG